MMEHRDRLARAQSRAWISILLIAAASGLGACGGSGGGGGGMAPASFAYPNSPVLYNVGLNIAPNVPTLAPAGSSWSVSPSLPAGLLLDPDDGQIHGIPTVPAALGTYRVSATNAYGSSSFDLRLGTVRPASFAFAASIADQSISAYIVDPKTGELRPHGYALPATGSMRPHLLTPSKDGRALYVPYQDSHELAVFEVDALSGQWSQTSLVPTGLRPMHFLLHPSADVAYLALSSEHQIATYGIDPLTHAVSEIAPRTPTGFGPQHLAIDPTHRFLFALNTLASTISAFAIDPMTQALSAVGSEQPTGVSPSDLELTLDGRFLYVVNSRGHSVTSFAIDTQNGALTPLGATPVGMLPVQSALDPTGRFLYVGVSGEDVVRGFRIDEASGALTSLGAGWGSGEQPVSLCIDPAGQFLYAGNNDTDDLASFRIDPGSGALTPLARTRTRDLPLCLALAQADAPLATSAAFAYVVNRTSKDLSQFTAGASGSLTTGSVPSPLGSLPRAATLDASNRFLFVADGAANTLCSRPVDPIDGTVGPEFSVQPTGPDPRAIAVDPSGRFAATANAGGSISSFRYDADGTLIALGDFGVGGSPMSVGYEPTGRYLFSANGSANTLSRFSVDAFSGAMTELLPRTVATGHPRGLGIHPSGRLLYVSLENINRVAVFALGDDGSLTLMSSQLTQQSPVAVAIDPRGQYAYSADYDPTAIGSVSMFSIDSSSGALSALGFVLAGNNPISASVDPSARFVYVVNERSNDVSSFALNRYSGALTPISTAPTGTDPVAVAVSFRVD